MGSPVAPSSCLRATKTSGGVGVARRSGTEEIDGNGLRSMSTPPTGIWSKSLTSSGERRIRFLHATVTAPVQERISSCSSLSQLQLVEWTVHHLQEDSHGCIHLCGVTRFAPRVVWKKGEKCLAWLSIRLSNLDIALVVTVASLIRQLVALLVEAPLTTKPHHETQPHCHQAASYPSCATRYHVNSTVSAFSAYSSFLPQTEIGGSGSGLGAL